MSDTAAHEAIKARVLKRLAAYSQREAETDDDFLDEDQLNELKATFSMFQEAAESGHTLGHGQIGWRDLGRVLRMIGRQPSGVHLHTIVQNVAHNPTANTIDLSRFLIMMGQKLKEIDSNEELKEAWAALDPEDHGYVSDKEMRLVLNVVGQGMLRPEEINALVDLANGQGDDYGRINFVNFQKIIV
eukprot:gnl/Spiro4/7495_TR3919_c0_g1_i1.p1 gnl/Spiro4/7495_TR3919_c0_g1~~gnl/Spiro4/7495_TR3919_c0_g1_i1.p1  ORF type:complete len:195 (-),score=57.68 gnl/Spiro4/7495_TR3919_c0_g1_i1:92-652(-)